MASSRVLRQAEKYVNNGSKRTCGLFGRVLAWLACRRRSPGLQVGLGAPLGLSWAALGRSWGALGRSWSDPKSIKKSIRNLIRKQAESRREKMAQTLRLSMFQSLTGPAASQIQADSKSIETAFEVISSYIYMYIQYIHIYV